MALKVNFSNGYLALIFSTSKDFSKSLLFKK